MSRARTDSRVTRDSLREQADAWARRLRVRPTRVRVQTMQHKWGSCSARGTITLSAALFREPAEFRDFVIVHELLHLRVRNHGRLFRAQLSLYCPNWRNFSEVVGLHHTRPLG